MADEIVTVNDLVVQHAEKMKDPTEVTPTEKIEEKPEVKTDTPEEKKADETPPTDPLADFLKEFEVSDLDALRAKFKPKEEKVESPEEKEKRENLYKVELQKYAVENGLMKPDDFIKLETLKAKDDQALVYENWLSDWKEENPDVDPEDADRQAREDFESEYKINSTNEKTKARGMAKIAKEAGEMRKPLESAFTGAKKDFDSDLAVKNDMPDFGKKVSGFIQESIPAKVKILDGKDGDDIVPIEIDLTDDQRKEIYNKVQQKIMNSSTYQLYKKGDMKQVQELAKREAESIIWNDHRDAGLNKIAETFLKRGDEKGYKRGKVGAENPFPLVGDGKEQGGKDQVGAQQAVLNSLQGKK
jgi:hypothetical protein